MMRLNISLLLCFFIVFMLIFLVLFPSSGSVHAAGMFSDDPPDEDPPAGKPLPGDDLPDSPDALYMEQDPYLDDFGLENFSALLNESMAMRGAYCAAPVRIMPLGDSITWGDGDCSDGNQEQHCSGYRNELWDLLTKGSYRYSVDFVGSRSSARAGQNFDDDNEGWPGEGTAFVKPRVYNWLSQNPADVVLLHIGTNDISGLKASDPVIPIKDNIREILDNIDRYERDKGHDVYVILAQIIGRRDSTIKNEQTRQLNQEIASLYQERLDAGDLIGLVNMYDAVNLDDKDMDDNLHPSNAGYIKMADEWYRALKDVLVCAEEDQYTVNKNSKTVKFNVLENDRGAALQIESISKGSAGGKLTRRNGFIEYTPAPGFFGQETFTYTLRSAPGMTPTAAVTVTVLEEVQNFFPLLMKRR